MTLKIIVHKAEEGGYWAEAPAIPGCVSQAETYDEVIKNIHEAIEGCLSVDIKESELERESTIIEIAV
ncbi:MAG: type II toxin-antitoxin system HicB family antitoxin [Ignavibacteria bacterium]|nr:type II toxin-antitoxin system HicB family antitoxin [Ignavibacteria bacterium]